MQHLHAALRHIYPDLDTSPMGTVTLVDRGDGAGPVIASWRDQRPQPDQQELQDAVHPGLVARAVAEIKALAGSIIEARYPEWRQRNMLAQMQELLVDGITTGPEVDAYRALWGWIKAVRAHSNELEAEVAEAEDPASFDIAGGWPE